MSRFTPFLQKTGKDRRKRLTPLCSFSRNICSRQKPICKRQKTAKSSSSANARAFRRSCLTLWTRRRRKPRRTREQQFTLRLTTADGRKLSVPLTALSPTAKQKSPKMTSAKTSTLIPNATLLSVRRASKDYPTSCFGRRHTASSGTAMSCGPISPKTICTKH